jgi:hypothetical protein
MDDVDGKLDIEPWPKNGVGQGNEGDDVAGTVGKKGGRDDGSGVVFRWIGSYMFVG